MTEDLLTILQPLEAVAVAAVIGAIPIVVTALMQKLGLEKNAKLAADLDNVLTEAAGVAYKHIAAHLASGGLDNVQVQNEAVAKGVRYVNLVLPLVLNKLGLTPDQVSAKVDAKLGQLLGVDPNVSVKIANPPPTVPVLVVGDPVQGGTKV